MTFLQKLMFWRRPGEGEPPLKVSDPGPDTSTPDEREYREEQQQYREEEEIQLREGREHEDDPRDFYKQ